MKIAFGQYSVSPIVTKKPKIDKISINRSHIIIAIVIVVLVADVKVESIDGIDEQKKSYLGQNQACQTSVERGKK